MKNSVKHLFYLVALLLLGSSFTLQPVSGIVAARDREAGASATYGGVHVVFAGKYGGEITRQEMAGQTELKVEGCARDARVTDFTLSITKNGKTSTLRTSSNVPTADMRTQLQSLNKGDVFEFRQAKAYLTDHKVVVDAQGSKFVVV